MSTLETVAEPNPDLEVIMSLTGESTEAICPPRHALDPGSAELRRYAIAYYFVEVLWKSSQRKMGYCSDGLDKQMCMALWSRDAV